MIKKTGIALIALLSLGLEAKASDQDLIIQSRLDETTTSWLIDKTRLIMKNAQMSDGLESTVNFDDTILSMDDLTTDPHFKKIQDLVQSLFKMDMKHAALRIRIPKIYYKVHSIHAGPKSLKVNDPELELNTRVDLQGLDIGLTAGVQVDFMMAPTNSTQMESYFTAFVDPAQISIPENLPPAHFDVDLVTKRGNRFSFDLKSANLDSLSSYVQDHVAEFIQIALTTGKPVTANEIKVNPVIIKVNQLSRTVNFDDFKPLVQKKLPQILKAVFLEIGANLKTTIGPPILSRVFNQTVSSDLIVKNKHLYTRFSAALFEQPANDQLALGISGDLCTADLFKQFQDACVDHMAPFVASRTQSSENLQAAKDEVSAKIDSRLADAGITITEDYINRLLKTTIQADLWNDMLAENHLKLGEKGAFVIFKESQKDPELYIDLLYSGDGKGLTSLFINEKHPLRFPLRMSTSLAFTLKDGVPFVNIKVNQLLSTSDEIIHGDPEYDLRSKLVWGIKKPIAKIILKMAKMVEGKTALDMDLPVFSGLGLEKSWYETSEKGRLNLYFKL